MQVGFGIPNNFGIDDPNDLVKLAQAAEGLGYNSVWVREHLFHSSYVEERLGGKPYHDALTVLIAIGQATEKVRLGTSVLVLPWHDPARLGKMVATLDQLSYGRIDLGIGVATTQDEFENLGVDFHTRGKRTDDMLAALQALWTQEVPEHQGEFYRYSGLKFSPKPYQKPYPPILVGGYSKAAFRRIVQFGDGWHTLRRSAKQFAEGLAEINRRMEEAGRDPKSLTNSITISFDFSGKAPKEAPEDRLDLGGTDDDMAETVRAYRDAGLDEIVVSIGTMDIAKHHDALNHFMEKVWPKV